MVQAQKPVSQAASHKCASLNLVTAHHPVDKQGLLACGAGWLMAWLGFGLALFGFVWLLLACELVGLRC